MECIHYGLALLLLSSKILGQYNYPTPATPFNGGAAPPQTSTGDFPQHSSTGAKGPGSGTLNANNYQNPGGSAFARPNEYPQTPQSGAVPSGKPTGSGYPPAGTPNGPAFPEGPSRSQQSAFPPLSASNSGPTGNFPASSGLGGSNYPIQTRPSTGPSNAAQEQGGFGSGYPGQGASQSSYPGSQRPGSAAFAGQNARPEQPQGAFGAASLDQSSGDAGPSQGNEGDFSAIPGEPDADYPIFSTIPQTSFSCDQQQYPGYYADVEARCQLFHVCANNHTYDFLCPNGTIFHQQFFVCVWWNQFDCNSAQSLYELNANLYDQSISGAQQQTGGIPGGLGTGPQTPQASAGSQIPSGPVGADGFQTPGYQPTGPGALPSASGQQAQPNSYPSEESPSSGGNSGYPSGGPSRPPHRPSTSPQVPNYPQSGPQYPNNKPHGTLSQSPGLGGSSTLAGKTPNGFPASTTSGRYQGSSTPTQGSQYLPPQQSGAYAGPRKPTPSGVQSNEHRSGQSGGFPQAYPGDQQPINGYRGQQTDAGYPNNSGANQQQGNGATLGVNSRGEQPGEGYSSAQTAGGGASGVPSSTYPNQQQSNGGFGNTRKPGGSQPRGYLPPAGK